MIATHEHELVSAGELARTLAVYAGPPKPRTVRGRRRRPRGLVAAAAVVILVFAGAAYAAGLDPFAGIGAADRPQQPSDALDPAVLAAIESMNARPPSVGPLGKLLPESARLVGRLPSGARIYAIATTTDKLCVLIEEHPGTSNESATGCGNPLSQSQPTTAETIRPNQQTPPLSFGIARDGVTAVSFPAGGVEKTIPVVDNVWAYEGSADVFALVVHFADGSTRPLSGR